MNAFDTLPIGFPWRISWSKYLMIFTAHARSSAIKLICIHSTDLLICSILRRRNLDETKTPAWIFKDSSYMQCRNKQSENDLSSIIIFKCKLFVEKILSFDDERLVFLFLSFFLFFIFLFLVSASFLRQCH